MMLEQRFKHAHLVGIGGVGMEGLARLLRARGLRVTGSDMAPSKALGLLREDGFEVYAGHAAEQVGAADLLVYSAAVPADNAEVKAAGQRGIACASRAEVLGQLSRWRRTVAVAGTHGKTTSAAMLAAVLRRAGLQPDILVGGWVDGRAHAETGRGEWLVVEADEYARSFLELHPDLALVTCVESEHLDCYGTLEEVHSAFVDFLDRLPFYGVAFVGGDDLVAAEVLRSTRRASRTYGMGADCDYRIVDVQLRPWQSHFALQLKGGQQVYITLRVPGLHNVRNAAGAAAAAHYLGVDVECIAASLAEYESVDRRFQFRGDAGDIWVVDDYAHHPRAVGVALEAARVSGRRTVAVFQPHLYSRTRDFAEEFARQLTSADRVVLTDVYPAREQPLPGVGSHLIEAALRGAGYDCVDYVADTADIVQHLLGVCRPGDVVLIMGAGNIGDIAGPLVAALGGGRQ